MPLVRLSTKQFLQHVISSKVMDNPLLHAAVVSRNDRWVPTTFPLWRCSPTRAMASSFLRFLDHTQHTQHSR